MAEWEVRGSDDVTYGPVSLDVLRQWAREGRLNAGTPVRQVGGAWREAGELRALRSSIARSAKRRAMRVRPKTETGEEVSGLALASFIVGLLGWWIPLFGPLLAFGLGCAALGRLSAPGNRAGGRGLAIVGIVSAIGMPLVLLSILLARWLLHHFTEPLIWY